jgi:hypothetical protein
LPKAGHPKWVLLVFPDLYIIVMIWIGRANDSVGELIFERDFPHHPHPASPEFGGGGCRRQTEGIEKAICPTSVTRADVENEFANNITNSDDPFFLN